VPPIDLSSTYRIENVADAASALGDLARGEPAHDNPIYARLHNPTVRGFELAMAHLEGTDDAVAFASGMAAITASLMAAAAGGHVVGIRPLYGGTDHLLSLGVVNADVTWATVDTLHEAVRDDTRLIWLETPSNPTVQLIDIERVTSLAGDVPVAVDSTFATPVLQQPARFGADLVIHSATKYLGGHSDVVGVVVACSSEWAQKLRKVRLATGGVMHPFAGYMLHRGLQTLSLRVEAAQDNAHELAHRLAEHPQITRVYYPGLSECDPTGLVGHQMTGPGAMLAFELDDAEVASRVMESVDLITPAVSLGATDTLIEHPASLTHALVSAEDQASCGIAPGLLRVSVGIEDVDDLWADLSQAIDTARRDVRRTA
jgi:methionine-gamma-lyase